METAAGQANIPATTEEQNALVFEATEDREIHMVWVALDVGACGVEVSFSSQYLLNGETIDDTSSGILVSVKQGFSLGSNSSDPLNEADFSSAPPVWDAGEEINVHCNNFEAGAAQVRVVIGYVPIGEFNRSTLRNR